MKKGIAIFLAVVLFGVDVSNKTANTTLTLTSASYANVIAMRGFLAILRAAFINAIKWSKTRVAAAVNFLSREDVQALIAAAQSGLKVIGLINDWNNDAAFKTTLGHLQRQVTQVESILNDRRLADDEAQRKIASLVADLEIGLKRIDENSSKIEELSRRIDKLENRFAQDQQRQDLLIAALSKHQGHLYGLYWQQHRKNLQQDSILTSLVIQMSIINPPKYQPPKIIEQVEPIYPQAAKRRGIQGTVELRLAVNTEGSVDSVKVVESSNDLFEQESVRAAKQFKFQPATLGGKFINSWVKIPFNFKLR